MARCVLLPEDGSYDCWWGWATCPPSTSSELVREKLLGKDGVIRKWLRAGAHGWRLDVADELSDDFLAEIKKAVLARNPMHCCSAKSGRTPPTRSATAICAATCKGAPSWTLLWITPFRDMVIGGFFDGLQERLSGCRGHRDPARELPRARRALACALNLLEPRPPAHHLRARRRPRRVAAARERKRSKWRLDESSMGFGWPSRFWLATLMQMTFPGVPSIYYGDEYGLGVSPIRATAALPTKDQLHDFDTLAIVKNASAVRRALPFMVDGEIKAFALNDDVLAYTRTGKDGEAATVIINRSSAQFALRDDPGARRMCERRDQRPRVRDPQRHGHARPVPAGLFDHLSPCRAAPAGAARSRRGRRVPTSPVPTDDGKPGTIGAPTRRFYRPPPPWACATGRSCPSIDGLLPLPLCRPFGLCRQYRPVARKPRGWPPTSSLEDPRRRRMPTRCTRRLNIVTPIGSKYCVYMAVKKHFEGLSCHDWPADVARYNEHLIDDKRFHDEAELQAYMQYRFDWLWCELMNYAHKKGIEVIGDIPMYVSDDSADAWSEPENFWLSDTGKAIEISGAPPRQLCARGAGVGNPTFRWDHMKENGYSWWMDRLRRAFSLYDPRAPGPLPGFHSYFSIPAGKACADGRWLAGPGRTCSDGLRRAGSA